MSWVVWFALLLLCAGVYVQSMPREGFAASKCPNLLIEHGNEIWLKNTSLAEVPGINPVVFHNLHEYTQFMEWQRAQKIPCPVLYLQKEFNTQNEVVYQVRPVPEHLKSYDMNV